MYDIKIYLDQDSFLKNTEHLHFHISLSGAYIYITPVKLLSSILNETWRTWVRLHLAVDKLSWERTLMCYILGSQANLACWGTSPERCTLDPWLKSCVH